MSEVTHTLVAPYRGLRPYTQAEADLFFGRDNDRAIIASNLFASRLTLLFGPSGVGKSSVLRAGVAYELQQQGYAVVVFDEWPGEPVTALRMAIAKEVNRVTGNEVAWNAGDSLRAFLATCNDQLDNPLFVILDQFEEFLLYHPGPGDERGFISEFARAINARDLRASFLISIREDFVAELDRFKGRIPQLFGNYLRLDRLDSQSAHDAIEKPLKKIGWTWEPEVVNTVIEQVQPGRLSLDQGGGEVYLATDKAGPQRVETPFLQIVMLRLWEEEKAQGSTQIHAATLERLGGPTAIVRQYLDAFMDNLSRGQQQISAQIFYHLVTPSGTKIAQSAHDLAYFTNIPEEHITEVLQALSGPARLLRTVSAAGESGSRYEIFHDALARPMLDWRRRFLERQQREEEQAARRRMQRRIVAAIAIPVLALIVGGIIWSQLTATLQLGQKQLDQNDPDRPLIIQQGYLPSSTGILNGFPFFFGQQIVETDWDQKDLWTNQKDRVQEGNYYLPRDPFGSASWVGQIALDSPIEKAQALWLAGDTSTSAEVLGQALPPKEGPPYNEITINLIRFLDEYAHDPATSNVYRQALAKYLNDESDKERHDKALQVLSKLGVPDEAALQTAFGLLDNAAQSGKPEDMEYIISFLGGMAGDDPRLGTLVFNHLKDTLKSHANVESAVINTLSGLKVTEPVSLTDFLRGEIESSNYDARNRAVAALSNVQFPDGYPVTNTMRGLSRDLLDRAYAAPCPGTSLAEQVLRGWAVRPETPYSNPVWTMLLADSQQHRSKTGSLQTKSTDSPSANEQGCDLYPALLKDTAVDLRANPPYDATSLDQRVAFMLTVRDHPVLSSTAYANLANWMAFRRKPMLSLLTPDRVAELTRAASVTGTVLVRDGSAFFSFLTDAVRQGKWDRDSALALISSNITATGDLNSEAARQWFALQTSLSPDARGYVDELTQIARGVLTDTHSGLRFKIAAAQMLMDNHSFVSSTMESLIVSARSVPTLTKHIATILRSGLYDPVLSDKDHAEIIAALLQLPDNYDEAALVARLADLGLPDEATGRQLVKPLMDAYGKSPAYYYGCTMSLENAIQRLLARHPTLARPMWDAMEPNLSDWLDTTGVANLNRDEELCGSATGLRSLLAGLAHADVTLRAPIVDALAKLAAQNDRDSEALAYILAALAGLDQSKEAWSGNFPDWAAGILTDTEATKSDWWLWYLIARDQPMPSRPLAEAMIASLSQSVWPGDSLTALLPMVRPYPDLISRAGAALLASTLQSQEQPAPQAIAALSELAPLDVSLTQRLMTATLTGTQQIQQAISVGQILLLPDLIASKPQLFAGDRNEMLGMLTSSSATGDARAVASLALAQLPALDSNMRSQWFEATKTVSSTSHEVNTMLVGEALRLAGDEQTTQAALEIAKRHWQEITESDNSLNRIGRVGTIVSGSVPAETLFTRWLFSNFSPTNVSSYDLLPYYRLDTITDTVLLQRVAQDLLANWCEINDPDGYYQPLVLDAAAAIVSNHQIDETARIGAANTITTSLGLLSGDNTLAGGCRDKLPSTVVYRTWYLYRQWRDKFPGLADALKSQISWLEDKIRSQEIWSDLYQNYKGIGTVTSSFPNRPRAAQVDVGEAIALAELGMTSTTPGIKDDAGDLLLRAARAQPVASQDALSALAEPILHNDPDNTAVKRALEKLAAIDNLSSESVTNTLLSSVVDRLVFDLPNPYDTSRGTFTFAIQDEALTVTTQWAARDEDLRNRIEAALLQQRQSISNTAYATLYPSLALARIRIRTQAEQIKDILNNQPYNAQLDVDRLLIANGKVSSGIDPREFNSILSQTLTSSAAENRLLAASGLVQQGLLSDANIQTVLNTLDAALDRPVIERDLIERFTASPITDTLERAWLWQLERPRPDFAPVLKMLGDPLRRVGRQVAYDALLRWAANTAPEKISQRVEPLQAQLQGLSNSREPQTRITANRTLEALYLVTRTAQVELHSPEAVKFEALLTAAPGWDERLTPAAQLAGEILHQREVSDAQVTRPSAPLDLTEPNDEPSAAREIRPGDSLTAAIDRPGDVDLYRIEAGTDSTIYVSIDGFSADKPDIPVLWCVLNDEGVQVYCQSSHAPGRDLNLSAGTYYLSVRDYPGDDVQAPYSYDLSVSNYPPYSGRYNLAIKSYLASSMPTSTPVYATVPPLNTPQPTPTPLPGGSGRSVSEHEPNDDRQQANPIRINWTVNAAIATSGDMDWFTFTAPANQSVSINVSYPTGVRFQPYLRLYNENGVVDSRYGSGGVASLRNEALTPGKYYIQIIDSSGGFGPDDTYLLSVTTSQASASSTTPSSQTGGSSCLSSGFDVTKAVTLTSDEVVNSELKGPSPCDLYTFAGHSGQVVTVTVSFSQTKVVDTFVCIVPGTTGGNISGLLACSGGSATSSYQQIGSVLPDTGAYYLFVTRFSTLGGTSSSLNPHASETYSMKFELTEPRKAPIISPTPTVSPQR